ncbi:IclR family transcriptional regulator [Desulfosporosinus lacus]|uniref:Transcriptional regulator, IclR family n=1 Tax=Desulfosporosinus lacus DSM 15449 TaxID=1121420 RepID=A0A1M5Z678_9FIRM|nr:IclR family transcriptional regulator [Desulfosporosinus lacus]SHI19767.1 transcriptional regulator, IclR family [Desulfosporosinus lacus DSM 15449]
METEEKYSIKVILKTMELLKCFSPKQAEWTANELSNKLNMNRTTVYRILTTLASGGFVQLNPNSGGFRLGSTLIGLSLALFDSMDIRKMSGHVLKDLAQKTGESVHLTIWYEDRAMLIDQWESPSDIKVLVPLGKKFSAHCTATGKVFLSGLSEEEFDSYLKGNELKTLTPNTITDKEELREEVLKVRQRQIAFDFEEYTIDIVACAAPVFSYDQKINAAIAVLGPSRRMRMKIDEIAGMTKDASEIISKSLGYINTK